jgi:chromosome segregation ATPase
MQTQIKVRMLEIDLRENTTNYNQLISDHELLKQSNEQILDQIESDNQRFLQFDRDYKQLQQQLNNSINKEKQMHDELNQMHNENERLLDELSHVRNEYETINTKLIDFEDQFEGWNYFSLLIENLFSFAFS